MGRLMLVMVLGLTVLGQPDMILRTKGVFAVHSEAAVTGTERDSHFGRVEDGRGSLGHAAALRFPSPLIEPDVRISCIRLSDWLHREAHGASDQGRRSRRSTSRSP